LAWVQAQDSIPFISSVELAFQKATLEQARGPALKVNHIWKQQKHGAFRSGLMFSYLNRPGASPRTTASVDEVNRNLRLNFMTGYQWDFGKRKLWSTFLEGYIGLRSYQVKGTFNQMNLGISREVSAVTTRGDFGTRLGVGFRATPLLSLQLEATASLIEVNHPLRFYTGILAWGPDSMTLLALSLQYRFKK
jgi:hypothetical protein